MDPDLIRLILVVLGVLLVAGIYLWDRYKRSLPREPMVRRASQPDEIRVPEASEIDVGAGHAEPRIDTLPETPPSMTAEARTTADAVPTVEAVGAAALDPELVAVQAHPSVAGMEEPDEPTLVMSFGVRLDSMQPTEGILSICYPRRALQALLTPASDEQIEIKVQAPVNPEVFEPLGDVPIEVRARLKASPISLRELADLQPGDVVVLNHKANQPVIITAGGSDMLEGHVGQYNKNVALSITRWTV